MDSSHQKYILQTPQVYTGTGVQAPIDILSAQYCVILKQYIYQMDNLENQAKAEALYKSISPYISEYSIKCYEQVLELNPRHVPALWNLGCIFDGDHDHEGSGSYWDELYLANREKALDCFTRIIDIDPKYSEAYKRLGRKYFHSNKEKALEYYLQYLNLNPTDYGAIASVGEIYCLQNKKEEAIANFIKCLQHDQKDIRALQNLAKIYEGEGNLNDALKCLIKCIEVHHNRPETHAHIGRIYDRMGNAKEAMNYYRKCNHLGSNKQAETYLIKHLAKDHKH